MEDVQKQVENKAEKNRDKSLELRLFGIVLEDTSPLLELYEYFSSEQMSEIETQLNFHWGSFHLIADRSQFENLMVEINELARYKQERIDLGQYITPPQVMELKRKYAPIAQALERKIDAL